MEFLPLWHEGSLFGFTSLTWIFPDLDLGMFVTTNGPARDPDTKTRLSDLLHFITDLLLGHMTRVD